MLRIKTSMDLNKSDLFRYILINFRYVPESNKFTKFSDSNNSVDIDIFIKSINIINKLIDLTHYIMYPNHLIEINGLIFYKLSHRIVMYESGNYSNINRIIPILHVVTENLDLVIKYNDSNYDINIIIDDNVFEYNKFITDDFDEFKSRYSGNLIDYSESIDIIN